MQYIKLKTAQLLKDLNITGTFVEEVIINVFDKLRYIIDFRINFDSLDHDELRYIYYIYRKDEKVNFVQIERDYTKSMDNTDKALMLHEALELIKIDIDENK